MARITMKFGGTSVGNAEALRRAAGIVRQTAGEGHQVVVVTSAMAGVTNLLIEGARTASQGTARATRRSFTRCKCSTTRRSTR